MDYSENYSELLHDWLDGTLSAEHEEALFIALGRDTALRTEMQDFMRLRAAIRNDTAAFTPSPTDTGAIFAKLGFAVPADIPSIPPASGIGASGMVAGAAASAETSVYLRLSQVAARLLPSQTAFKQFTLKTASILASACVASLLTILLLDWRNGNSNNNSWGGAWFGGTSNDAASGNANSTGFTPPPFSPNGAYPQGFGREGVYAFSDTSRHSEQQRVVVREIIREVVRYAAPTDLFSNPGRYSLSAMYQTQNEYETNQIETATTPKSAENGALVTPPATMQQQSASSAAEHRETAPNLVAQNLNSPNIVPASSAASNLESTAQNNTQPEQQSGLSEILHRLSIGVRGFTAMAFPAPTLEPAAAAWFNNAAVSLMYALSPHHAVGVEAGQEAFFQQYMTTENQDSYLVTQYPTQVWGGASYRYTLFPEQALTPFAGATVGLASYGIIGRTQLGCSYAPDAATRFVLGVEASSLFYGHQGGNYFSPKVGVTYGVAVRF